MYKHSGGKGTLTLSMSRFLDEQSAGLVFI